MRVKWPNVAALVCLLGMVFILVKSGDRIRSVIRYLGRIGPGNSTEDQMIGLIVLALIGVTLVALVKVIVSSLKHDGEARETQWDLDPDFREPRQGGIHHPIMAAAVLIVSVAFLYTLVRAGTEGGSGLGLNTDLDTGRGFLGLVALALTGALLVATVRILTHRN
jgi:hypothetical protein